MDVVLGGPIAAGVVVPVDSGTALSVSSVCVCVCVCVRVCVRC
jgi:hypothetical protein